MGETLRAVASPESPTAVGVCSIALDRLAVPDALDTIAALGADVLELSARAHRPGDPEAAAAVGSHAHRLGLRLACYGSYLNLLDGLERSRLPAPPGLPEVELDIAKALGAHLVRVWAGGTPSATAGSAQRRAVRDGLRHLADAAGERALGLVVERHAGTLADDAAACERLLVEVDRPAQVALNYQLVLPKGLPPAEAAARARADAARLGPLARHCHVYDLAADGRWRPLGQGEADAAGMLTALHAAGYRGALCVEFAFGGGDPVAALRRDIAWLRTHAPHG